MRTRLLTLLTVLFAIGSHSSAFAQFPAPYCSVAFPSAVEPITNVTFSNINNSSSASSGSPVHDNFLNLTANLVISQSYPISVEGYTGGNFTTHVVVYIDWNGNNSFSDGGESYYLGTIVNSTGTDGIKATGNITVPMNAVPGTTRMRVIKRFSSQPDACNNGGYGQAEDYTVNIVPLTNCSGMPAAGTATSTISNILCAGANFTLGLSGSPIQGGITYQWQQSTDNITFTNMSGATGYNYTTTQSAPIRYYRARIICTNSNDTAYSAPVTVTYNAGPTFATLPFTEGFENVWMNTCNTRELPNNSFRNTPGTGNNSWRRNDDGAAAAWTNATSGDYSPVSTQGNFSARFHSAGAANSQPGQLNVYVDCSTPATTKRITFDYINTSGSDSIAILLSTNAGTSFARIGGFKTTNDWENKSVPFNSNSATTIIRIIAFGDLGSSDIGIDNMRVSDFDNCTGMPVGGTTSANKNNVCLTTPFTVTATGFTDAAGITYQWEKADTILSGSGFGPFTAIAGATNTTHTTTQGLTTKYRLKVTCTLTGDVAYSAEVVVSSPPTLGGNYIIDKNAASTDLWPLPGKNTFKSFNAAISAMACGIFDHVYFTVAPGSGPYAEHIVVKPIPGGSASRTVTFFGNGESINLAPTAAQKAVIKLSRASYIRFDSLVINMTGTGAGMGVLLIDSSHHNVISRSTINIPLTNSNTNTAGIAMNDSTANPVSASNTVRTYCDSNTFRNNIINGGFYGVALASTDLGASGYNLIEGNDIRDFHKFGVYLIGTYNSAITKNRISRPTRSTVDQFIGIMVDSKTGSGNLSNEFSKNRIFNPFGGIKTSTAQFTGISFEGIKANAREHYVTNNAIYYVNGMGSQVGINLNNSDGIWCFHNTISLDSTAAATQTTRGIFHASSTPTLNIFYNNIVNITRAGAGQKHAIYLSGANALLYSDFNDLYVAGTNAHVGYFNGNRTSLVQWQAATASQPCDVYSKSINPLFVDINNGDGNVQNAAIDNRGTFIGIMDDILGNTRNTGTYDDPTSGPRPDMGAWEFVPPPCTPPVLAGTIVRQRQSDCWNTPVNLSLNGNSFGGQQEYQWQVLQNGSFVNFGTANSFPDTTFLQDTTITIRAKVSCGVVEAFSDTILNVVSQPLYAGTYTIDSSMATNYTKGSGNFRNFTDAASSMGCGITGAVVFDVQSFTPTSPNLPGVYNEQIKLRYVSNSSTTNTITFKGNGNTLKYAPLISNERAVLKMDSAKYYIFDSLRIDATEGNFGFGVQFLNDADSNTFRKCTILASQAATSANQNFVGVVMSSSPTSAIATGTAGNDANWFDQNIISGGYYGVTVVGGNSAAQVINDNKFTNNIITDFFSTGMYVVGTNNTLIEGNLFTRPNRTTSTSTYGIQATTAASSGLKISKNRFTRFFTAQPASTSLFYGIYHNSVSGTNNAVTNNIFYGLDGNGLQYAIANSNSADIAYYHNTIVMDDTATLGGSNTSAMYFVGNANGIDIKNNLIYVTRNTLGNKHGIYISSAAAGISSDFNNIYVSGGNRAYTGFLSGNKITLSDWQAANTNGNDANSLALDPLFDTTLGFPYGYKPVLYPLDDKGTPVGITTDIIGEPRSTTTPDIGALEFAPAPCVSPLVAGTASVNPTAGLCLEQPITLDVAGHSPLGLITFQWESASSAAGPFTPLSGILYGPKYDTLTAVSAFYRAKVSCGGTDVYTNVVSVTLNPILAGGTYTIDSSAAAGDLWPLPGKTTFLSFTDAVAALQCGITDKVVFNVRNFVSPQTGQASNIYREQIRISYVPGTSAAKTITFQSHPSNASQSVLTYHSVDAAKNYTLLIDSTTYLTFNNLELRSEDATLGRVVEFRGTASNDSILNSTINMVEITNGSSSNTVSGIYTQSFRGENIVLQNNTINNGVTGIYISGLNATTLIKNLTIRGNTINNTGANGIFAQFVTDSKLNDNTINLSKNFSVTSYGIFTSYFDSAYQINNNAVNISNSLTGSTTGISINSSRNYDSLPGEIKGNKVYAINNNTSVLQGIFINNLKPHKFWNNVVSIETTGSTANGLTSQNSNGTYFNNSIQNNSSAVGLQNYAAYFNNSNTTDLTLRNNIFSHTAKNVVNGRALHVFDMDRINSNYNMLYSAGPWVVSRNKPTVANFASVGDLKGGSFQEKFSISGVAPAFISKYDLRPDLNNDSVWAMHGRGVQIKFGENNLDINGSYRPDSVIYGVPDLGAYEFYPNVPPVKLKGVPEFPVANQSQYFMFGSDSVMRLNWGNMVPDSISIQRHSGVAPIGLPSTFDSMYFYNKVNVPNPLGSYNFEMKQFFVPSWQGTIEDLNTVGLGRTNKDNAWVIVPTSKNKLTESAIFSITALDYADKFTGLVNPFIPPVLPDQDSSNTGRRFWVAYPANQLNGGSTQQMVLYIAALSESANVQVKINGTNWVRNYFVPAGTVLPTEYLPKSGPDNAFIQTPGLSNRGISIHSDVPINVYTHTIGSASSGGTTLLPVGVWAYEYSMLCITQDYGASSYSYFYVIADNDNTVVEITPTVPVQNAGMAVGVPTTVTLNKGEWYQVLASSQTQELSGSTVKSVPNSAGKCYPIAMFSGSTRTAISGACGSGGDFIMQQNFPYSAWGTKYLTAPTSRSSIASQFETNIYRVLVKDPTTVVKRNGTTLTGLSPQRYYQFTSNTPDYITADKPIMVAQFEGGSCTGDVGDPEMIYVSPIDQGIKDIAFYRNTEQAITVNYLTLIIPANGVPSLVLKDAGALQTWDVNIAHPNLAGYRVMVKRWASAKRQVTVTSDSAFTAITYGQGSVESYGYNAGTLVKTLVPRIGPIVHPSAIDSGSVSEFTCAGTPFYFNIYIPLKVTSLTWHFSKVPGLSITSDSVQINPEPIDSAFMQGRWFYMFTVQHTITANTSAVLTLPISFTHPDIESCDSTFHSQVHIQVTPKPEPNFDINFSGCIGDSTKFHALSATSLGLEIGKYKWDLLDGDTAITQDVTKLFTTPGDKTIKLSIVTNEGCFGDTSKTFTVNPLPEINFVNANVDVCYGQAGTIDVLNPDVGTVYNWYDAATGGNLVFTGTSFSWPTVTTDSVLYVEATSATGCMSAARKMVKLSVTVPVPPSIVLQSDNVSACVNTSASFVITSVEPNTTYQWYDNAAMTGSPIATGATFTIANVTSATPTTYYIKAVTTQGCGSEATKQVTLTIGNIPAVAVVATQVDVCAGNTATASVASPDAQYTYTWWDAPNGGNQLATGTSYTSAALSSSTNVYVQAQTASGCISSRTVVSLMVTSIPVVTLIQNNVQDCEGNTVTLQVQAPSAGLTYAWSGPGIAAGTTGTTVAVTQSGTFTVTTQTTSPVCSSVPVSATVNFLPKLAQPVVSWDQQNQSAVEVNFTWAAVTGAVSYEVATSAAGPWTNVGNSLSYSLKNMLPTTCADLFVRAVGTLGCQISTAGTANGCALDDKIEIANSFTPNGDGLNDVWYIKSPMVKEVKMLIFNQWGQKVFEGSGTPATVRWDGRYKGELLPTGVYVYVLQLDLKDNTRTERKGSLNLIR